MPESFGELGLRSELVDAVALAGYEEPSSLQSGTVPVVRRGGNAVIRGSAGAGVVGAYCLGLIDRLAETASDGTASTERAAVRALVLVPTTDAAAAIAASIGRFAAPAGLSVRAVAPGWAGLEDGADVAVSAPAPALRAVQTSALKLEHAIALVVHDAAGILGLGHGEALETLTNSIPREAQRVVVSGETGGAVAEYVERHVRRPLHVPARPAIEGQSSGAGAAGRLEYVVASESGKLDALAALLLDEAGGAAAIVHCRTGTRAELVAAELAVRGLPAAVTTEADAPILVTGPTSTESRDIVISHDVPFDAGSLATRHAAGGTVVVEPRELPHLLRIAGEAKFSVATGTAGTDSRLDESLDRYRERITAAAREEDLAAQLLVLAPLFEVLSHAEVAAAASALLRKKPARTAQERTPAVQRPAASAPPGDARTWTRLFISAGSRDGIRPGDLVGSITGEAGLTGEQVGRIEIRDTFSIVEVESEQARRVIEALNGTTLRGRSLRVDYDRRSAPAGTRRGGR